MPRVIELAGEKIKLFNLAEIAKVLNVTTETARNYLKKKRIKGKKIGREWCVTEKNLIKFIKGGT